VARMLAAASVKDADFQALVASFAEALGKISGDDRSFAYSCRRPSRFWRWWRS